jgi:transposase InsO family protein
VRDHEARPAPDLVNRNLVAPAPNCLWVAEITYIPIWAGFLYLAVVLDTFSRCIVGWGMVIHLRTELVLAALNMAIGQRRPAAMIHHPRAANTLRWPSVNAAMRRACGRRWVRSAIASTTPCARVSLPPSNANYSTVVTSNSDRSAHGDL